MLKNFDWDSYALELSSH